jgi:hypothetical protein
MPREEARTPGRRRRSTSRLAASLAVVTLAAIAFWIAGDRLFESDGIPDRVTIPNSPSRSESATDGYPAARPTHPTDVATPALPDGALVPLLGEPRGSNLRYCDETLWSQTSEIIRSMAPGEIAVDEAGWRARGIEGQGGLAAWVSRCRQEGASVMVLAAESGATLGFYSTKDGYRTANPP